MDENHSLSSSRRSRARSIALAIVLWAFGLSTTTLLVGVWGRTVASDQTAMSTSLASALDAETVSDQITDWVVDEALSLPGTSVTELETAIHRAVASPAAHEALRTLIEDFIVAASAPPGTSTVIDVRPTLEPLGAEVAAALSSGELEVSRAEVDSLITQLEGLVLTSSEGVLARHPVAAARSTLTVVMLVGAASLLTFGTLATLLSRQRLAMLRTLANRLVVSAITFALFLRISAWAVDPGGGRAPVRTGGAVLLGSNQGVVWAFALAGLAVSVAVTALIRSRRSPVPAEDSDEETPPATAYEGVRAGSGAADPPEAERAASASRS